MKYAKQQPPDTTSKTFSRSKNSRPGGIRKVDVSKVYQSQDHLRKKKPKETAGQTVEVVERVRVLSRANGRDAEEEKAEIPLVALNKYLERMISSIHKRTLHLAKTKNSGQIKVITLLIRVLATIPVVVGGVVVVVGEEKLLKGLLHENSPTYYKSSSHLLQSF
jgi:hypothetical protein